MYYFEGSLDSKTNTLVNTIISPVLENLGLSLLMTFEECVAILCENRSQLPNHFLLRINSNNTPFNKSLPVQTGCIIEFVGSRMTHNRQSIKLYDFNTNDVYIGSMHGTASEYSFLGWTKLYNNGASLMSYIGSFKADGTVSTVELPYAGMYLILTTHNSVEELNSLWVCRTTADTPYKLSAIGTDISLSINSQELSISATYGSGQSTLQLYTMLLYRM